MKFCVMPDSASLPSPVAIDYHELWMGQFIIIVVIIIVIIITIIIIIIATLPPVYTFLNFFF